MKYHLCYIFVLVVLVFVVRVVSSVAQEQNFQYETEIAAYEKESAETPLPENCTMFIGSSTWRLWGNQLEKDFAEFRAVNRGFGGSTIPDILHVMHRIITPHKPARVVFFCGGNDIARGAGSEETFENFKTFLARLHAELPNTEIFFVSVTDAPIRERFSKQTLRYNALVKEFSEKTPKLHYIDTFATLVGEDGKADEKYFQQDRLHLNRDGEKRWIPVITDALRNRGDFQGTEKTFPEGTGFAARFKADTGIADHPDVIFSDNFETGDLGATWDSDTIAKTLSFSKPENEFCGQGQQMRQK